MDTKEKIRNEDRSDENGPCREDATYGAVNGLDDYRMDENGFEQMEQYSIDDCFEGYPI